VNHEHRIRVGLVQMRCEKGAIIENREQMAAYIAEAARRDIDILGFPEMSLTGYADPIRSPETALRLDGPEVADLLITTRGYSGTVLVGLIEANPAGKPFITQIVARRGALIGYYRKITIENEEVDWFSPGQDVPVFQHGSRTFGIAICADIGNRDVFARCRAQGAEILLELAAPGLYGEQSTRDWQASYAWWEGECQNYLSAYAREFNVWILVATQAGRTIDEDFPGGAFVFAPGGARIFATRDGSPGPVFLEIDLKAGSAGELP
jgi:predicted amidohydrolase